MATYKRGNTYWFEFWFNGERIRESTKQSNKRVAETIEAAKRTQLAKGEVGIEEPAEAPPVPTFRAYAQRVIELLKAKAANQGTVAFYESKLKRLLEFPALANAPLDQIGKQLVNQYIVFARRSKTRKATVDGKRVSRKYKIAPATVNRQLATCRMILYHALEEGIIAGVPKIGKSMLDGEREREFVLPPALEPVYLAAAPQPLCDAGLLMLDTGLRVGEAMELTWPDIHLKSTSSSKFGYVHVSKGKTKNAKCDVPLTPRVNRMLALRKMSSSSGWVFPSDENDGPFLVTSLDHQHERVRETLKMPADFVVHGLRHTMLTRLGLSGADVFTIKKIAGHSSVQVSEKYVHPSSESKERAIERMMTEYGHISADHGSVGKDAMDEMEVAKTPHKSPHSGKSRNLSNPSKLLQ
jgi:integrase